MIEATEKGGVARRRSGLAERRAIAVRLVLKSNGEAACARSR